jgi:Zn-dependent M28 family amino/carboxypeptidase
MVNVVATLEGVDPVAKARTLVVSGHYDSMCSNVMNSECDAPGANDDASGTAVVMELACVFAKSRFPATLVFMAVAREEQGLLGATHWAKVAHERGVNVEAMITNDIVGNAHDDTGRRDATVIAIVRRRRSRRQAGQRGMAAEAGHRAARTTPRRASWARTIRDAAMR